MDGSRHFDGDDRGYQLCNPVCVDRRVRRTRLAGGGQATVFSPSPLDVAQLSVALLSRGAQAIRRIGNRDAGAIGVVRSHRVVGKLDDAADRFRVDESEFAVPRPLGSGLISTELVAP